MGNTQSITVKKNDCPWTIAKRSLASQNKKNNNNAIVKEMERLAKLNGCDDVNDFEEKFFKKIGGEIKLSENNTAPTPAENANKKDLKIYRGPNDTSYVAESESIQKPKYSNSLKIPKEQMIQNEIKSINAMKNDLTKIIQYNKKFAEKNYVVVDKKTCTATVYDKNGKRLNSYEVMLGASKGDDLSTAFAKDTKLAKNGRRTVPGEYKFTSESNEFGGMLRMGAVNNTMDPDVETREWAPGYWGKRKFSNIVFQAMHGTASPETRNKYYNNNNLEDNRQSLGCVNIPVENLKEMKEKYGIGVGSTIYILPETKGNSLKLQKQKDGTIKFVTHYADEAQNEKLARINNKLAEDNLRRRG